MQHRLNQLMFRPVFQRIAIFLRTGKKHTQRDSNMIRTWLRLTYICYTIQLLAEILVCVEYHKEFYNRATIRPKIPAKAEVFKAQNTKQQNINTLTLTPSTLKLVQLETTLIRFRCVSPSTVHKYNTVEYSF